MYEINKLNELEYDELISVSQNEIKSLNNRPEAKNKIRKILFFLSAEGLTRTISKVNSKRDKSFIFNEYRTIITIRKQHKKYANYSIQTSKDKECFVIQNKFFEITEDKVASFEDNEIIFNQFSNGKWNTKKHANPINLKEKNISIKHKIELPYEEGVFIYGLGDYSRVYIAPNIKNIKKIFCVDYVSKVSTYYKKKYGYEYSGIVPQDSYNKIMEVKKPLVIIATYHSDHSRIANEIFNKNPNSLFFIEKPPCVTLKDIAMLVNLYKKGANIEIGYNRRFIPINQEIKRKLKKQRVVINISVKEILINENHWYFWENQGTRITGNLTHWIDLCNFWIEDEIPTEINMLKSITKDETFSTSILYSKGSLVNLTVSDKGNPLRGVQERIEIKTASETFFIDDYMKMYFIKENGKKCTFNKIKRTKGHDEMYKHVIKLFNKKDEVYYRVDDLIKTSLTTYYMSEMFKKDIKNFKIEEIILNMLKEIK